MQPDDFERFARSFLGVPYIWGADGPDAFDCSGYVQTLLARLALDPPGDQTADALYRHFARPGFGQAVSVPDLGCLVFYGKPSRIGHVAMCLNGSEMIEAGGGGPETTTVAIAREEGAEVRVRPITRRRDLVAVVRPVGLPWPASARPAGEARITALAPDVADDVLRTEPMDMAALVPPAPPMSREEFQPQLAAVRNLYWPSVLEAAGTANVAPSIICGIGSRESAWGLSSLMRPQGPAGTGDWTKRKPKPPLRPGPLPPDGMGFGRGLMQIDWDTWDFARLGNWQDPRENILFGAEVLRQNLRFFARAGGLSPIVVLRAAIAAYNAGPGRVLEAIRREGPDKVDAPTTRGNYAADVLARAAMFRAAGTDQA